MRTTKALGLLCFTLYLFHILRNLTPFYFIALGLVLAIFLLAFSMESTEEINFDIVIFFSVFVTYYASFVTIFSDNQYGDPAVGLFRLWATFPLGIICLVLASDSAMRPVQVLTIFYFLAALTLPIQYVFGAINWFAEASERAGGLRWLFVIPCGT
ncbi:hypothetical protein [Limnohabitans planktonicus]|uniref:hypothetical protein n=1 Tax=Limnohabitans planktonicus TaxID=540060 RepID=UPI0010576654|nr:hypothetical protein [Limnohabitans planktonicus]